MAGKFVVRKVPSGIKFDLKAGNGEVICTSEVYTTKSACMKGIASVKKNAAVAGIEDTTAETVVPVKCPKFQLYNDKGGNPRFRLIATNGQVIASCGEPYSSLSAATNGAESVKRNAPEAAIVEE